MSKPSTVTHRTESQPPATISGVSTVTATGDTIELLDFSLPRFPAAEIRIECRRKEQRKLVVQSVWQLKANGWKVSKLSEVEDHDGFYHLSVLLQVGNTWESTLSDN